MVARVKGGRLRGSFEPWPGYVDVLSTLLMVIIFVLMIFVVAQFFLGNALSGRDEELLRLSRQVQELNEMLGLERKTTETLRGSVGDLSGELQTSVSTRDTLERQLKTAKDERSAMAASLAQAQAELEALQESKTTLQQKLAEGSDLVATRDALNQRLTVVIGERDALATRLADAESRIADLTTMLTQKTAEAARLAAELALLRTQLATTESALADTRSRAETAETTLQQTRDTLAATQSQLDATTASLTDTQGRLGEAQSQLRDTIAQLSGTRSQLGDTKGQLDDTKGQLAQTQGRLADTEAQLGDTRQQLTETATRLDHATSRIVSLQASVAAGDTALAAERAARAGAETRLEDAYKTIQADSNKVQALLGDISILESLRDELEKKILAGQLEADQDLSAQQALADESQRQVLLLNAQLLSVRQQLANLQEALGVREAQVQSQQIEITELGNKLNAALVSKVQELERYRSEFFGRLREVLGSRQDVQVVGDRFVFQSEVLFDTGSATVGAGGQVQLAQFAQTLLDVAAKIPPDVDWLLRVDGHTDSRPIASPEFPSNWELSTARAIAVVKFLESRGIEPKRLAATGFGQFRPLAEGTDEDSLRKNRRIERKLDQR